MTLAPMRTVSSPPVASPSRWTSLLLRTQRLLAQSDSGLTLSPARTLAQVRPEPLSELWFTASFPSQLAVSSKLSVENRPLLRVEPFQPGGSPGNDHKPPDERTLKLGQTLRTLSPLLPNILSTPLPQEILSPTVSLHLFPSTHPHLPVVKGRIPYKAALWTAPVAWGCVPVIGNVKLDIMSEKIIRSGFITAPTPPEEQSDGLGEEKLVVRWRTEGKKNGDTSVPEGQSSASASGSIGNGGINRGLSTLLGGERPLFRKDSGSDSFSGLFVFSFDSEGRIASHTIEHADEAGGFDKTSRVVTLADWLLGKAKWGTLKEEGAMPVPGLAYRMRICREGFQRDNHWRRNER